MRRGVLGVVATTAGVNETVTRVPSGKGKEPSMTMTPFEMWPLAIMSQL